MKVLADLHHGDLYYSLQLLFEKRLGAEIYRPIGLEWYHEGFWDVYPHINTAKQYLDFNSANSVPKDIHGNELPESLWGNVDWRLEDGIYYVWDFAKDQVQRAVTLEKMKSMKFDIIIASMPNHVEPFLRLAREFQPQAKVIFQVGNPGWGVPNGIKNVLDSSGLLGNRHDVNIVAYHQEFDLEVFKYVPPTNRTAVNSYVHYMQDMALHRQAKERLPDWQFMTYGAGMEDDIGKTAIIAQKMQESGWTWHMKRLGDGFGHVLHNTYASGRPAIINIGYNKGQWGGYLLEDQVTCVDTSIRSIDETAALLRRLSEPEEHNRLCENAHRRFTEVVSYDEEEVKIREFISRLQ